MVWVAIKYFIEQAYSHPFFRKYSDSLYRKYLRIDFFLIKITPSPASHIEMSQLQFSPALQNLELAESSNKNQDQKAKCCGNVAEELSLDLDIFIFFLFSSHIPSDRDWPMLAFLSDQLSSI